MNTSEFKILIIKIIAVIAGIIIGASAIRSGISDLLSMESYASSNVKIVATGYCGAETSTDIKWTLDSDGVLTMSGTGDMKDFDNMAYGNWTNYSTQIKKLVIEEGITSIGAHAFQSTKEFTGGLTIPSSVTTIGDNAFTGCTGFTGDLVIPDSVTSIGREAFANTGFDGKLVLPKNLTEIKYKTFSGCRFTGNLIIPDGLKTIGDRAFDTCKSFTGDLVIPNSVTSIEYNAFASCSGFDGNLVLSENLTEIATGAFYGCRNITGKLVIPDNVKTIGIWSFYSMKGIDELIVGTGTTYIGEHAFDDCTRLTKATINGPVEEIGRGAFWCIRLHDITLSPAVTAFNTNNGVLQSADGKKYIHCASKEHSKTTCSKDVDIDYLCFYGCDSHGRDLTFEGYQLSGADPYDGSQNITGYESTVAGQNKNQTWLYKSAKWTDEAKTEAELRLDLALGKKKGVDVVFIVDSSYWIGTNNMIQNLASRSIYGVLDNEEDNNRVAMVTYGGYKDSTLRFAGNDSGFIKNANDPVLGIAMNVMDIGGYNASSGFITANQMIEGRQDKSREAVVIFLTTGMQNDIDKDGVSVSETAQVIKDNGIKVYVAYNHPGGHYTGVDPALLEPVASGKDYIIDLTNKKVDFIYKEQGAILEEALSRAVENAQVEVPATTLSDVINNEYFKIPDGTVPVVKDEDGNVIEGAASISANENGQQVITCDLTKISHLKKYSITVPMTLNKDSDGKYYSGSLNTNLGDAQLYDNTTVINAVGSPALVKAAGKVVVPTKNGSVRGASGVRTGDASNIMLWTILMVISCGAIVTVLMPFRKQL